MRTQKKRFLFIHNGPEHGCTKIQLIPIHLCNVFSLSASSIDTLHLWGRTSYGRLDVCQTGRNRIELSEHPALIRPVVQRPGPRRQHLQRWRIRAAAVRPSHGFEQLLDFGFPFLSRQVQRSLSSQLWPTGLSPWKNLLIMSEPPIYTVWVFEQSHSQSDYVNKWLFCTKEMQIPISRQTVTR